MKKSRRITQNEILKFATTQMAFERNEEGVLFLSHLACDLVGDHFGAHFGDHVGYHRGNHIGDQLGNNHGKHTGKNKPFPSLDENPDPDTKITKKEEEEKE